VLLSNLKRSIRKKPQKTPNCSWVLRGAIEGVCQGSYVAARDAPQMRLRRSTRSRTRALRKTEKTGGTVLSEAHACETARPRGPSTLIEEIGPARTPERKRPHIRRRTGTREGEIKKRFFTDRGDSPKQGNCSAPFVRVWQEQKPRRRVAAGNKNRKREMQFPPTREGMEALLGTHQVQGKSTGGQTNKLRHGTRHGTRGPRRSPLQIPGEDLTLAVPASSSRRDGQLRVTWRSTTREGIHDQK